MFSIPAPLPDTAAEEFVREFFSDNHARRFVFGRNQYSANLASIVDIEGFIDDYTDDKTFCGKPILRVSEVPHDSMVVSCVTVSRPITALCRLHDAGLYRVIDYFSLSRILPNRVAPVTPIRDSQIDFAAHRAEYEWLHTRLADAESRSNLENILRFRVSADLSHMAGFEFAVDRQYFEDFLLLRPGEVFVDGGAFDGQTTLEFIKRCPGYAAVHVFEPSLRSMDIARRRLSPYRGVHFHQTGLYDSEGRLSFDPDCGPSSRLDITGPCEIDVSRLDHAVETPVSFIKLDLEGAEARALRGAKRHILEAHPKLAVAVYHQAADFWRIPRLVLELRDDYDVMLRHYTEGWTETVMFFVPRP